MSRHPGNKEDLKSIKQNWNEFAARDPLWSILPLPEKKNNRWTVGDFFASGEAEIDAVLAWLREKNIRVIKGIALDFGCGVGRLTQALSRGFKECVGVDISERMIELAGKYNRCPGRCRYVVNDRINLKIFGDRTFDFIYSSIVFQHMPPHYTLAYLKEFMRILKPGGLAVFQMTTREARVFSTPLRNFVNRIMPAAVRRWYKQRKYGTWAVKNMYTIEESILEDHIRRYGGLIIGKTADCASLPRYLGFRYCVSRPACRSSSSY